MRRFDVIATPLQESDELALCVGFLNTAEIESDGVRLCTETPVAI